MKKIFLNDVRSFVFTIFLSPFALILLIFSLLSSDDWIETVSFIAIFGGITLLVFVCMLMFFELIMVYDNMVVSIKVFKRVEISYSDVVSINEINKDGMGAGGIEEVWEIKSFDEKAIYFVRSKRRKKIIEQINQKIQNSNHNKTN